MRLIIPVSVRKFWPKRFEGRKEGAEDAGTRERGEDLERRRSSSSFILPPSSFPPRVSGKFNILASLRHLNVLQFDARREFLNAQATNCSRRVKTTDYFRGNEERNLVDQP